MNRALPLLAALFLATASAEAQVQALTLPEMVAASDHGVFGRILSKRVARIDAADGRVLYYTTMTIEGRLLDDGTSVRLEVSYPGGFLNEEEGYWHSESPGADETRVGSDVVLFYKWTGGMGNALQANWLYANHGGLYRTVVGPQGPMALGRGQGYALAGNLKVTDLESSVQRIRIEQAQQRNR